MLIAERRRRLLEQVRQRGYASFRELADTLGISESTVRRDLRLMVAEGLLEATRGGVGPMPGDSRPVPDSGAFRPADGVRGSIWAGASPAEDDAVAARYASGPADDPVDAERQAIAAHAATLVKPGSAILLGPGRTTYALARRLMTISSLTVVTNSVLVTQALLGAPQIDVVMVGGTLRRSIGALVGPVTEQTLQGFRGDQVFLSGDGVTVDRGLTTPNVFAAATDQALMAAGRQVVVLADHTKLGHDTMCQTVPTSRIDVLVTDAGADPEVRRLLAAAGVDVQAVSER
ncbi:DeoR/GlpR family DNA-binding transcription regulator [Phytohabitans aurantiacus]|jgi:DeoR/GlpR family transcriptional regulator of sugar metabolism|uniref:DeoR family transcriptional regulator n=1 Tax=Phytohabitans aurantiacus TaxID=3016789 RepID=A0ABQ5QPB1_9ACTN|nr:DeoR/GlpR family DNA-binding transcription regulator [Phytohabitans aurantiacus]GLH96488.1 DeoR family transcriptional regulator [Phytohabitans aurantiacus]